MGLKDAQVVLFLCQQVLSHIDWRALDDLFILKVIQHRTKHFDNPRRSDWFD